MVLGRVIDKLPKVRPHSGFPAADVHVEHLHALELVDDVLALPRGQLARVALARGRQAVHTGQVAGVGQFPGEADGRIQPLLELIHQFRSRNGGDIEAGYCGSAHEASSRVTIIWESASTVRAC
ncbi:Uncharacterised protein [Mycobacteroides abscessus subsp. abscessus]|nr:Uncharacterised protein [Mycobacteroides abscessus subsp. abscessus]